MLWYTLHFNRNAARLLLWSNQTALTLGQLLQQEGHGARFRDAYLLPMAAPIWSSSPSDILQLPAAPFLRFCLNHSLLQVNGRPQWRTVAGGAGHYVHKIAAMLPDVRLHTLVYCVLRGAGSMQVWSCGARAVGREAFRVRELLAEPAAGIAVRGTGDRDVQSAHPAGRPCSYKRYNALPTTRNFCDE